MFDVQLISLYVEWTRSVVAKEIYVIDRCKGQTVSFVSQPGVALQGKFNNFKIHIINIEYIIRVSNHEMTRDAILRIQSQRKCIWLVDL